MQKILAGLALSVSLGATSVYAGGMAEPIIEPEVIVEDTSSSAGGIIIPLLLLILIAAAISSSDSGTSQLTE